MAEFLTAGGIPYYMEQIIKETGRELFLLTPYLQVTREFYELLKETSDRNVSITIIYAGEDLYPEQKLMLGELANLEIYQSENLNAKCCCGDENVLISSMELHQLTGSDGLEMGTVFNRTEDPVIYKKISLEIKSILGLSKNMNLHRRPVEELVRPAANAGKIYHGFCVKCAMPVSYKIENPYCRSCMPKTGIPARAAAEWKYCHICGAVAELNGDLPLCGVCSNVLKSD